MDVAPKNTTKPENGRRRNLLIASSKGTLGIFSEAMSTNSKTGKQAKGTCIFMKGLEQRR